MSDQRRFTWSSGRLPSTPLTDFWQASLTVQDPQVPNLPLETPEAGGSDLNFAIDTAGAITIAGQVLTAAVGQALTPGAITIAGQVVASSVGQELTAGAVTIAGQTITAGVSQTLITGAVAIAGQSLAASVSQSLASGLITVAGQALSAGIGVTIDVFGVTVAGQTLTAEIGIALSAGAILIAGQSLDSGVSGGPEEVLSSRVFAHICQRRRPRPKQKRISRRTRGFKYSV